MEKTVCDDMQHKVMKEILKVYGEEFCDKDLTIYINEVASAVEIDIREGTTVATEKTLETILLNT